MSTQKRTLTKQLHARVTIRWFHKSHNNALISLAEQLAVVITQPPNPESCSEAKVAIIELSRMTAAGLGTYLFIRCGLVWSATSGLVLFHLIVRCVFGKCEELRLQAMGARCDREPVVTGSPL